MNRRGFLRTALCAAGATAGAMAVGKVGATKPPLQPGIQVGSAAYLALPPASFTVPTPTIDLDALPAYDHSLPPVQRITGPDPSTLVHVGWTTEWPEAIVLSPEPFIGPDHRLSIPRAQFPEYDERHDFPGILLASNPMRGASGYDELVKAIRGTYAALLLP